MTAAVLDDEQLKAQLLGDIRLTIERWSRKLYLLDSNIVGLIQQLEVSIQNEQNHVEKRRAAA